MKKLFTALTLFLLAACIDVGDVTQVWDKATIDPALEGTWRMAVGQTKWRFAKDGDMYRLQKLLPTGEPDGDPMFARSITAGKRQFMVVKDPHEKTGQLVRFELKGNAATQYDFGDVDAVVTWIKDHHPQETNFVLHNDAREGFHIKILYLTPALLNIVAEIPDSYWSITGLYVKANP